MTIKNLLIVIHLDLLLPLAVLVNLYLYFYPVFHFCAFAAQPDGTPAPFRLLALADPQIEGDTTLQKYKRANPDGTLWDYFHPTNPGLTIRGMAKALDLWGNDLYLAHVYRTTRQTLDPTHTAVLGDLLGSQWIDDEEFRKRGERFWRIFSGGSKVTLDDVRDTPNVAGGSWRRKLITLPGNHDIGYAGDMTGHRIDRFEGVFGPVNYAVNFVPTDTDTGEEEAPTLRIMVLNSLTLDSPILDQSLQDDSYALVDASLKTKSTSPRQSTLLLTHLPFNKPAGVCVDPPLFTYYPERNGAGIREQNHLSEAVSDLLLGWIFGVPASGGKEVLKSKQSGIVLTGHDHEGCDVRHYWDSERPGWNTSTWADWSAREQARLDAKLATKSGQDGGRTEGVLEGVREVTVRSMMGEYAGNSGLLSAWFDPVEDSWKFDYETCKLGVQHIWWAVHIVDVVVAITGTILFIAYKRDEASNAESAARVQDMLDRNKKDE